MKTTKIYIPVYITEDAHYVNSNYFFTKKVKRKNMRKNLQKNLLYLKNSKLMKFQNTNIIMKLLTEHFDITNYGCILDLFTDKHIFYYEFDNNHKITLKLVF